MTQPQKIKVVYLGESADALMDFVRRCGGCPILDLVGAFRPLSELAAALSQDTAPVAALDPDVIVIGPNRPDAALAELLTALKNTCPARRIGLLPAACAEDLSLVSGLDYVTEISGADGFLRDDDSFTHLVYQIKTARLALMNERSGIHGKWAILPVPRKSAAPSRIRVIAIGASAGGTQAIAEVLSALPADLPPILIVQHISDRFTQFFADNLSGKITMKVVVAHGGEKLEHGAVYIAGDAKHLQLTRGIGGEFYAKCSGGEKISGHRPSVDVLFSSVATAAGSSAVGVILTGMGSDGAQGLLEMREAGAYTIGQDQETSAVYGMPMVAHTLGAVARQLPLSAIADEICSAVAERREGRCD